MKVMTRLFRSHERQFSDPAGGSDWVGPLQFGSADHCDGPPLFGPCPIRKGALLYFEHEVFASKRVSPEDRDAPSHDCGILFWSSGGAIVGGEFREVGTQEQPDETTVTGEDKTSRWIDTQGRSPPAIGIDGV